MMLFYHMLLAANDGNPLCLEQYERWMFEYLTKHLHRNSKYFQFMELQLDFVFKIYYRIPLIKKWF
jgi:hypothetical protein